MLKYYFITVFLIFIAPVSYANLWQQGFTAYEQKSYEDAIEHWQTFLSTHATDTDKKILTYSLLGDANLAINQLENALQYLDNKEITELAAQTNDNMIKAHFFNNRANMWMLFLSETKRPAKLRKYYHRANEDYHQAFDAALTAKDYTMLINILSNETHAHLKTKEHIIVLESLIMDKEQIVRSLGSIKKTVNINIKNALPQLVIARDHLIFSILDSDQDKTALMLRLAQLTLRYYRVQPKTELLANTSKIDKPLSPIKVLKIAESLLKYTEKLAGKDEAGNQNKWMDKDVFYIKSYANGLLGEICEYYIQNPYLETYYIEHANVEKTKKNAYCACADNFITTGSGTTCNYYPQQHKACFEQEKAGKTQTLSCIQGEQANQLAAYDVALLQTRTAMNYVLRDVNTYTPSLLYLWYWRTGRILQQKAVLLCEHDKDKCEQTLYDALLAYQNAVQILRPIQSELISEQRNSLEMLNEHIKPVYFGLAKLLLQHAEHTPKQKQHLLESAIQSIESIKKTELEEYFQSDCLLKDEDDILHYLLIDLMKRVLNPQAKWQQMPKILQDKINKNQLAIQERLSETQTSSTALLYPIIFKNQVVLLLRLPNGEIHYKTKHQPNIASDIQKQVHQLRRNLEAKDIEYTIRAKQLYDLLIAPLKELLQPVETLIIVPDELLRTIPFSALLNRQTQQFLIQEVALVTIPSYNSVSNEHKSVKNTSILLNGLSVRVGKFEPLPNVKDEINNIKTLFQSQNPKVLINESFIVKNFADTMKSKPYSIVHIASHGKFKSNSNDTFLLTHDKDTNLSINKLAEILKLNQSNGHPVELLTLSACETAAGDQRAALGIAGVAIKSGARSAIASLWSVKDDSTAKLMQAFYKQLGNMPKAKAFQAAQITLIQDKKYNHPNYWAAFLLIGNWL